VSVLGEEEEEDRKAAFRNCGRADDVWKNSDSEVVLLSAASSVRNDKCVPFIPGTNIRGTSVFSNNALFNDDEEEEDTIGTLVKLNERCCRRPRRDT